MKPLELSHTTIIYWLDKAYSWVEVDTEIMPPQQEQFILALREAKTIVEEHKGKKTAMDWSCFQQNTEKP